MAEEEKRFAQELRQMYNLLPAAQPQETSSHAVRFNSSLCEIFYTLLVIYSGQ